MAAGMTLKAEQLDAFREKLNSQCTLEDEDLCDRIRIDMEIPFSDISLSTAEELQRLEPFGKGNEKAVFATRHVLLRDAKILGAMRNAFRCNAVDADGTRRTVMWFGATEMLRDSLREKFAPEAADAFLSGTRGLRATMLYQPRIYEYNGSRYLQLLILDLGPER